MTTETILAPHEAQTHELMAQLATLRTERATLTGTLQASVAWRASEAAREALEASAEYQAIAANGSADTRLVERIKGNLAQYTGVISTPWGKAGNQIRRTVTVPPAAVQKHAPQLADLVTSTVVDKSALEAMIKAAVKAGKLPPETWDRIYAESQVSEGTAWIFQPAAAGPATVTASAETCDAAATRAEFFKIAKGTGLDVDTARATFLSAFTDGATSSLAVFVKLASADEAARMLAAARLAVASN